MYQIKVTELRLGRSFEGYRLGRKGLSSLFSTDDVEETVYHAIDIFLFKK